MIFLRKLLENSRLLSVLHDNLSDDIKTSKQYNSIAEYLEQYAFFNNISAETAIEFYTNYITIYNKHCKQFIKSAKYPVQNGFNNISIAREEYDIVLLFSVLFTPHRFRIMQLLQSQETKGRALFIGLGPGLEIMLMKDKYSEISAYDLSVNKFLFSQFPNISLNTELYVGQRKDYFDAIFLIELLEHLEDPYSLLKICNESLKTGGRIFLTTATDIPQFDHLYNFTKDHKNFENELKKMNFTIFYQEQIPHNYLTLDIKPYNHFYVIEK